MTDYTPTTAEVRGDYAHFQVPGGTDPVTGEFAEGLAEFDRWLTEYARVKQAEALEEFAKAQDTWCDKGRSEQVISRVAMRDALRARAAEYREGSET